MGKEYKGKYLNTVGSLALTIAIFCPDVSKHVLIRAIKQSDDNTEDFLKIKVRRGTKMITLASVVYTYLGIQEPREEQYI